MRSRKYNTKRGGGDGHKVHAWGGCPAHGCHLGGRRRRRKKTRGKPKTRTRRRKRINKCSRSRRRRRRR